MTSWPAAFSSDKTEQVGVSLPSTDSNNNFLFIRDDDKTEAYHQGGTSEQIQQSSIIPNNQDNNLQKQQPNTQTVSLAALPPFFTPFCLENYNSAIIHYDKDRSMVVTCKYTPQHYNRSISLPLEQDNVVYCVKASLTTRSTASVERDAEISNYLQQNLEDNSIVPKFFTYLSDYFILVREFVKGKSLREVIDMSSPGPSSMDLKTTVSKSETNISTLTRTLETAIDICSAVALLHSARVCHCDLRPENFVIVDTERSCVKLIDFGLSCFLPLNNPFIYTYKPIGSYMYMSPEATGKLPKPLGFHCDIYSLGIVLFEMFTKEHPFKIGNGTLKSTDYMYLHLTQHPELVYQNLRRRHLLDEKKDALSSQATQAISLIISKMIRKPIEQRYMSMEGVKQDLEWVLKCIQTQDISAFSNFMPGMHDVQTTLNIPFTIYGRDDTIWQLINAFKEMQSSSLTKLILLRGYSGIGKSCLVREFRVKCGHELLYFEAKYNQHHNIPYFGIKTIISAMIESVLGESEQFISELNTQLSATLNIQHIEMLCEMISNFSEFFSNPATTLNMNHSLEQEDAIHLFAQAVIYFIRAYCQMKQKPLCVFLDDLQWSDYESMRIMLKEMIGLGTCETFPLLIIGAFRDNEVYTNILHPLKIIIETIKSKMEITEIEITELKEEACNLLVADSLNRNPDDTTFLTKVLISKTKGNPFFLKQLLASLAAEKKIFFDRKSKLLTWNIAEIERVPYSQNVVDFLLMRLENMNETTKQALAFASCIGNRFSLLDLLDVINAVHEEYSMLDLKAIMSQAIKEGWVSITYDDSQILQFNHDRLQQAANASLSEKTRNIVHYTFGEQLLNQTETGKSNMDDLLFDIVVHLNYRAHDSTIFENRKTRRLLLNLNTMAAKKAINLGAIEQARTFVNIARELLLCENTNIWEEDSFLYNIAFDLLIAQGNCEYSSNIDSAISIFNSAIERSKTKHHLYQACYHAQMAYVSLGQFEKVFEILQSHIFPSKDELKFLTFQTDVEQLKLFMKTKMDYLKNTLLNRFTSKQDIMNLPDLNDLEKINFINILAMSSPGVYCMQSANSNYIYMIIILVCSEIILQHGLCEYAPFVLCALGWFWCTFELYPHMHIFVEGGVELARTKYKNQKHLAACLLLRLLSFFILPVNSLEVWNMAEEAFLVTMKSNNKDIGVFTIGQYTYHHFFDANGDMKTAISLSNKVIETLKHMGNFGLADTALAQLEMKQVLCGEHERFEPPYLTDVFSQPFYSYYHFMFKGISLYFQRSVEEAFQCFEKTYELRYNTAGLNNEWLNALFNGLTACEYETYLLKSATAPSLVDRCDKLIEYSLQTIEKVSHTNPLIFQCWHQLLLAERLLVDFRRFGTKNTATIISTYNRCLKLAIQERNLLIQKLAYWKIGVLYHELEMDDSVSGRYFSHAYAQFNEMGIIIFADYLWTNYRQQIEAYEKSLYENQLELSKQPSSNISSQDSFIDLSKPHCLLSPYNKSVIEENSDLDLKEIFTSILPLIREHTEAKRCCLMLKRNSILYLDAELTTNKQDSIDVENTNISPIMTIYEGRAIDSTLELPIPVTMAYRTLRTKTEQLYPKEDKTEPYFEKNQKTIFSALCVPVIRERSSIGCIYLENSENASGFSVENVTMANLIISVSIDNATIFSSINNSFTRFLPSEFLKMIGKTHVTKVQPGDAVTKEMTILFADIFGFTEIIEQLLPKEGFHFVNRLLLELAPPVSKHEGFIYRYLGDAIMALFPDPNSAVMAALEIISNLEKFNKNNICNIKIGVGISNGTVNIGTVGYEDRIDATIISDTTYIAAACESLTRVFNTQIIVTESVIPFISSTATNDHVHLTLLGQFILPHHNSKARNLYDVKKKSSKTEESWLKERSELTQVLDLFRERNFRECFSAATQLIKQSQNKCMVSICRKYMEACERYADHQLPEDWCGEIRLGREGEIKPYPFSV